MWYLDGVCDWGMARGVNQSVGTVLLDNRPAVAAFPANMVSNCVRRIKIINSLISFIDFIVNPCKQCVYTY